MDLRLINAMHQTARPRQRRAVRDPRRPMERDRPLHGGQARQHGAERARRRGAEQVLPLDAAQVQRAS
jgi:hypothetical protein